jgi:hypothetical protein
MAGGRRCAQAGDSVGPLHGTVARVGVRRRGPACDRTGRAAVLHRESCQAPDLCRVKLEQRRRALDADVLADQPTQRIGQAIRRLKKRLLCGFARIQRDERGRRGLLNSAVLLVAGFVQLAAAFPGPWPKRSPACSRSWSSPRPPHSSPSRRGIVTRTSATGSRPDGPAEGSDRTQSPPTSPHHQTRHTSCIPAASAFEVAEEGATFRT